MDCQSMAGLKDIACCPAYLSFGDGDRGRGCDPSFCPSVTLSLSYRLLKTLWQCEIYEIVSEGVGGSRRG